jgi:hypothetical protein
VFIPNLLDADTGQGSIAVWADGSRFDFYAAGAWHGVDEN